MGIDAQDDMRTTIPPSEPDASSSQSTTRRRDSHTLRERIFKALFTYVSTRFGLRSFEKCFENTFPNVCSAFQHLRLGSIIKQMVISWWCVCRNHKIMLPKRRFWKVEQTCWAVISKHFSMVSSPNWVVSYVKSALKTRSEMFVQTSRRQLVPYFSTISILNISTKVSTWIRD